jgi:hypothetical protein
VADAIDAGVPPRVGELPDVEALKPVTDTVPAGAVRARVRLALRPRLGPL